jgi:hypothetical protein
MELRANKIQTLSAEAALSKIPFVRSYRRGQGRKGYSFVRECRMLMVQFLPYVNFADSLPIMQAGIRAHRSLGGLW